MIERRSMVLTGVVLAMLFTGMLLYLFTSGDLQQAKVAIKENQDLGDEAPGQAQGKTSQSTYAPTVAGVVNEDTQEEPQDVAPTAATGVKGYVVMAAGLAVLMGLIGLVTAWRKSSARQVEL